MHNDAYLCEDYKVKFWKQSLVLICVHLEERIWKDKRNSNGAYPQYQWNVVGNEWIKSEVRV